MAKINKIPIKFLIIITIFCIMKDLNAQNKNGFDLKGSLIPVKEILSGGPPRDGIPSIDSPNFVSVSAASYMKKKDRILGIYRNGIAKAYPIKIMNWHEIVNDRFGSEAIVITYCPLCGSGVAYQAKIKNLERTLASPVCFIIVMFYCMTGKVNLYGRKLKIKLLVDHL